jgi:hypothetical protein
MTIRRRPAARAAAGIAAAATVTAGLLGATTHQAHADSSCTALVESARTRPNGAPYEFVYVSADRSWVAHHRGIFRSDFPEGPGPFGIQATAAQHYSDRMNGQQPFTVTDPDQISLHVSPNGIATMRNNRWNLTDNYDMSCQGNMMINRTSSALVTIAVR